MQTEIRRTLIQNLPKDLPKIWLNQFLGNFEVIANNPYQFAKKKSKSIAELITEGITVGILKRIARGIAEEVQ